MTDPVLCAKCGKDIRTHMENKQGCPTFYQLRLLDCISYSEQFFCSRQCLIEFMAPELKQAVVVKQWIPTPEDEERMHQ